MDRSIGTPQNSGDQFAPERIAAHASSRTNEMTNETIVTPTGRRVVLAGLLAALCIAAYRVLEPFLEPLLWAAILAYVSWPLYVRLQKPLRGYATVSALLMTVALIAALLLPVLFLARTLAEELMIAYGAISLRLSAGPPELPQLVRELPWLGERLTELFQQYAADPTWLRTELGHWVNRFSGELANIAGGVGRNVLKAGVVGPVILAVVSAVWVEATAHKTAIR